MNELETLHGYAERFLGRLRSSITIDEFRGYLRNLEEDVSTLTNSEAASRIAPAIASIKQCDYVFRNNPEMKASIVIPAVEKLLDVIRAQIRKP